MRRAFVLTALVCAGCGGGDAMTSVARQPPAARVGDRVGTLPRDGFAVQRGRDVELVALDGTVYARLRQVSLPSTTPLGVVFLVDAKHKRLVFDPRARTLRRFRKSDIGQADVDGCTAIGRGFSVCNTGVGSTVRRGGTRLAGMPEPQAGGAGIHGYWRWGWASPDDRTLLLQRSGECEVPNAFFADVESGALRPVTGERDWRHAPESEAYGWLRDGRAVVYLPRGGCGNGTTRTGYYAIDPHSGRAEFLRATGAYWTTAR